ncbi:hypothetical protein GGTG_13317 [Gaeumannomyces tritici R3-111a-1]|uniref:Uncharacterized protein n=1 Tax=Gaeumannomyces tritici (strain R3-111a-1) TaxID=644352 RepID=J3PII9_GAET3|nr:hypothetical protein GGTG_13317 [Gaeumannomyces tritici R3-111a-1]EJT69208.1 hypothetical protein GGTG_13317 [Gaeumannomyces tritici R3-111a-1]
MVDAGVASRALIFRKAACTFVALPPMFPVFRKSLQPLRTIYASHTWTQQTLPFFTTMPPRAATVEDDESDHAVSHCGKPPKKRPYDPMSTLPQSPAVGEKSEPDQKPRSGSHVPYVEPEKSDRNKQRQSRRGHEGKERQDERRGHRSEKGRDEERWGHRGNERRDKEWGHRGKERRDEERPGHRSRGEEGWERGGEEGRERGGEEGRERRDEEERKRRSRGKKVQFTLFFDVAIFFVNDCEAIPVGGRIWEAAYRASVPTGGDKGAKVCNSSSGKTKAGKILKSVSAVAVRARCSFHLGYSVSAPAATKLRLAAPYR